MLVEGGSPLIEKDRVRRSELDQVGVTILDAVAFIEEHGWTRKGYAVFGRRCAVGGLRAVSSDKDLLDEAQKAILLVANRPTRYRHYEYRCVEHWNDDDKRTSEEVLRTMRAAAENRREKP
jgi:hypothetical protein